MSLSNRPETIYTTHIVSEVRETAVTCTTLGAIYPVARVVFELPGGREFKNTTANRFSIATQEEYVSPIHHRANNSTI